MPKPVFVRQALEGVVSTLITSGRSDGYVRLDEAVTVPCSALGINRSARQRTSTSSSLDVGLKIAYLAHL